MGTADPIRALWPADPADIARALINDPSLARLVDADAAKLGHTIVVDPIDSSAVAELAVVQAATVQQWRHRQVGPSERGYIAGGPPGSERTSRRGWSTAGGHPAARVSTMTPAGSTETTRPDEVG
jgi:hypothetical protein